MHTHNFGGRVFVHMHAQDTVAGAALIVLIHWAPAGTTVGVRHVYALLLARHGEQLPLPYNI